VKKYLKILFLLLIISVLKTTYVNAASNPYKASGPYGTNCTWYAWKMAKEKGGVELLTLGDAKSWYSNAKNKGYLVGTTPKANSIIVWANWTDYGHVGYVEKVEGNILHVWDSSASCIDKEDEAYNDCIENSVSEESDKICYANAKQIACEYTINPDEFGITGYIYLDEVPNSNDKEPTKPTKPITPEKEENKQENENITESNKSSNAYLSSIRVVNGFIDFDKETYVYNMSVEYKTNIITFSATPEDNKALVNGTGTHKLKLGLNRIVITVTAEDGSIKEYTINVTRKERTGIKEETTINNSTEDTSKKFSFTKFLFTTIFIVGVVGIIYYLCKKNKSILINYLVIIKNKFKK